MTGQRLQTQFSRLHQHFDGKDSDTNLQDMSDILCCTRRNARMVLAKMADKGWISWRPSVGRGKLSRLTFHRSQSDLELTRIQHWIREGKLDSALEALDNNAVKLAQLIQQQLGASTQEGKQIIRLPYYRPMPMLNPAKPIRRSEQHLIRQIFSGLTRLNEETDAVEPDIAHHWELVSPRIWRFYIRPAIHFHDDRLLTASDIISTLTGLKEHALFSHIETVTSPADNIIDIKLGCDDYRLPYLLTTPTALIRPKGADERKTFDRTPIGTGPYKVVENNDRHLILNANDRYFGFRALTDVIEIWVLDSASMCYLKPDTNIHPAKTNSRKSEWEDSGQRLQLDEGCNYLLLNKMHGMAKDPRWANYLKQRLSSLQLLPYMSNNGIGEYRLSNAFGLLPGWMHNARFVEIPQAPGVTTLRLAHQSQHPLYPLLADAIKTILKTDGIELEILVQDFDDFANGSQAKKIDIWLGGMSLGNKRSDAIVPWLLNFDHLARAMKADEYEQLKRAVEIWLGNSNEYFDGEEVGRMLVRQCQIVPLFHIWLGVTNDHQLQNISSNKVGWFDFKSAWQKPEWV